MKNRDAAAKIIHAGILRHWPHIRPRALELVLARVVALHREHVEEAKAERGRVVPPPAAKKTEPLAPAPLPPRSARRPGPAPRAPNLLADLVELRTQRPGIEPADAYAHFERIHGSQFITFSSFRDNYWRRSGRYVTAVATATQQS